MSADGAGLDPHSLASALVNTIPGKTPLTYSEECALSWTKQHTGRQNNMIGQSGPSDHTCAQGDTGT